MKKCDEYLKTLVPDCEKPVGVSLWFPEGMPPEAKKISNGYDKLLREDLIK